MLHLLRPLMTPAAYCGTFALTGYNVFKLAEPQKTYPTRQVDHWFGSCPPFMEYRSLAKKK
jgi:hypothetical protein